MSTDTSRTTEIYASPARQLTLLAFGGMSFALAAGLAFNFVPNVPNDAATVTSGYFGMAFFGLCAGVAIWRLWAQRGAIITLSPQGLRDVRVAAEPIPWSAIKEISTGQMQRQSVLVIAIDPAAEQRLTFTRVARWMREAHRNRGVDGFVISAQALKVGFPTLFYTCRDYWEAWRSQP